MDNLITGLIALALFAAFTIGLAESIGKLPFILIVAAVLAMLGYDFYQSARQGMADERAKKNQD